MRNGTIIGGTTTLSPLGLDGGGWVTGIDIAADGYMVCRNDTADAHVRGQSDTTWRALFKPGVTYPTANQLFKNPAQNCYEVCIAPSNSLILYASAMGRLWKSTDRGFNWTLLTGFKSNALDIGMTYGNLPGGRIGGQHMRVSPSNPNNAIFVHPVDGAYYTTDGGTTWTLISTASVPAPTDLTGGNVYFVSDTDVWITTKGNQPRHSTTGVNGTFSAVSGGPTVCSSISGGGGKVYFCGDGQGGDTQLYVWTGAAFATLTSATGGSVAVNPTTTTKVVVSMAGGAQWTSTDTGVTFTQTTALTPKICNDVPYLGSINSAYLSLGATVYDRTLDRLFITCGVGVFYLDSPPLNAGTNLISITKGIRQMLPQDVVIAPGGTVLVPAQDKAGFVFTRANVAQQASRQAPDNSLALRQGGAMDYAADDETYLGMVYAQGAVGSISTNAGATWAAMPTIPTFTQSGGGTIGFYAGNLSIGNKGNMVWVSSSNGGGGVSTGGVKYTTDYGATWLNPTFGASVNMTGAMWHGAYTHRRRILAAYKQTPGTFYLFCNGTDGTASAADLACLGVWKSTDGGANFTKIRAGHFVSYSVDYYHAKLRLVANKPGHFFWVQGNTNNYPTAPYSGGLWFTPDDGTTLTALTGWSEPEDLAVGAAAPGASYGAIYVLGWRGGVYGLYRSIDFVPATPNTATWQLQETWLLGRPDFNNQIGADPNVFGRVVVGISGGGGGVGDNVDVATGT